MTDLLAPDRFQTQFARQFKIASIIFSMKLGAPMALIDLGMPSSESPVGFQQCRAVPAKTPLSLADRTN